MLAQVFNSLKANMTRYAIEMQLIFKTEKIDSADLTHVLMRMCDMANIVNTCPSLSDTFRGYLYRIKEAADDISLECEYDLTENDQMYSTLKADFMKQLYDLSYSEYSMCNKYGEYDEYDDTDDRRHNIIIRHHRSRPPGGGSGEGQ